jgi:mannitol-1-phosphate/altronate dehydrogenase
MKKLLIYGAGAIGRGYLPRVFTSDQYEYYYVETNSKIREPLKKQKFYTSCMSTHGKYDIKRIPILDCFDLGEETHLINKVDAIMVAVGPRNFMKLKDRFVNTKVPILCFENDDTLAPLMRSATGNKNVVFCIPDVIASPTAPQKFLDKDPLSIMTENGVCFAEDRVKKVGGNCNYVSAEELRKQWLAKLFIHNTPHCITAYFGNLLGVSYVHEVMQQKKVVKIIEGVMGEMEKMLQRKYNLDPSFLKFYSAKELARFADVLLCDPISRVAREPFRKLAPNERLIGAAQLCLSCGFIPKNLLIGIMGAFCFESESDPDFHIKYLMKALTPEEFLRVIIRLQPEEALYKVLVDHWQANLKVINGIKNEK